MATIAPLFSEAESGRRLLASQVVEFLDLLPDCVSVVGLDGAVQSINAAGLRLFDFDDASRVGRSWISWWPEEIRAHVEDALEKARAGAPSSFFGYCPTAKGVPKWWDVTITPLAGADGRPKGLLCVARDITRALREAETRLRALADNIAQLAWMADSSGYIFWYNKRWYEYTGTTPQEVAGWGWKKCHHPDHIDRVIKKFSECVLAGETWEDTFPLKSASGEYRWFLSRAMPTRDEAGRITLWCGTNTDITEARQATARLQRKARLIELSHEAILAWELDGEIITWNRGCEQLYGFSRAEAIGAKSHDLLKTRLVNDWDAFLEMLRRERAWSGELIHSAKDGTEMWIDSRMEVVDIDGRSLVLESNRDITERRRADETRELLIGELHHRVKNTLAIVQSLAKQTARNAKDIDQFLEAFEGRLRSIAAAHGILTESDWSGARLRDLIEAELRSTVGDPSRVEISGENVFLAPQTALHLALILHELAVNAIKHGALSVARGRVRVNWTRGEDASRIAIVWKESGGPPVRQPTSRGFGAILIERSQLPQLSVRLSYAEDGVECRIEAETAREDGEKLRLFKMAQARTAQSFRSATSSIR